MLRCEDLETLLRRAPYGTERMLGRLRIVVVVVLDEEVGLQVLGDHEGQQQVLERERVQHGEPGELGTFHMEESVVPRTSTLLVEDPCAET